MGPYFMMLALAGVPGLAGARRTAVLFTVVFFTYWIMIGFRYQVGMDWDNYLRLQNLSYIQTDARFSEILSQSEPGFAIINWLSVKFGGGMILVNATSSIVFCIGFFKFASRCREPFIAVTVGTPLLAIAFAMSGVRQAIAIGIIFFLFATWERRTLLGRIVIVIGASFFHFSALFIMVFVALGARVPPVVKIAALAAVAAVIALIIFSFPSAIESYSELYVSGQRKLDAPGAVAQVGVIATAALIYWGSKRRFDEVNGENPLQHHLAITALLCVPAILVSSVGAYRFALYLWPMAMYVWSGIPQMIDKAEGRAFYRLVVIGLFVTILWGWLTFANNASAWIPYENWLLQPEGAPLRRGR